MPTTPPSSPPWSTTAFRAFCLARKDLTGASTATLFIQHLPAVTRACQDNANGIWVVRQSGLRRLR